MYHPITHLQSVRFTIDFRTTFFSRRITQKILLFSRLQLAEKVNIKRHIYKNFITKSRKHTTAIMSQFTNRLIQPLSHVLCNIPQLTCKVTVSQMTFGWYFLVGVSLAKFYRLANSKWSIELISFNWFTKIFQQKVTLSSPSHRPTYKPAHIARKSDFYGPTSGLIFFIRLSREKQTIYISSEYRAINGQ